MVHIRFKEAFRTGSFYSERREFFWQSRTNISNNLPFNLCYMTICVCISQLQSLLYDNLPLHITASISPIWQFAFAYHGFNLCYMTICVRISRLQALPYDNLHDAASKVPSHLDVLVLYSNLRMHMLDALQIGYFYTWMSLCCIQISECICWMSFKLDTFNILMSLCFIQISECIRWLHFKMDTCFWFNKMYR